MQAYDPLNNYGSINAVPPNNTGPLLPRQTLNSNKSPSYFTDNIYGRSAPNTGSVYGVTVVDGRVTGQVTSPCAFSVRKSSNQSIGTGHTQVVFATELYDVGDDFTANAFTAPFRGIYHFDVTLQVTAVASLTAVYIQLVVNGTDAKEAGSPASASVNTGAQMSADILLAAGDVVTVTSAGNVAFTCDGSAPQFSWWNGHIVSAWPPA